MAAKKKTTKKPKTTKFTIRQKIINCPHCGSKKIEDSYGTAGYKQCNRCGREWRHPQKGVDF
jgi:transcription elongation factor Elf1